MDFQWHDLSRDEQQKYYELARDARAKHLADNPGWTARNNYAINKRKRKKRDRNQSNMELKKCRARFGVDQPERWCKHCRRKKKCMLFREEGHAVREFLASSDGPASNDSLRDDMEADDADANDLIDYLMAKSEDSPGSGQVSSTTQDGPEVGGAGSNPSGQLGNASAIGGDRLESAGSSGGVPLPGTTTPGGLKLPPPSPDVVGVRDSGNPVGVDRHSNSQHRQSSAGFTVNGLLPGRSTCGIKREPGMESPLGGGGVATTPVVSMDLSAPSSKLLLPSSSLTGPLPHCGSSTSIHLTTTGSSAKWNPSGKASFGITGHRTSGPPGGAPPPSDVELLHREVVRAVHVAAAQASARDGRISDASVTGMTGIGGSPHHHHFTHQRSPPAHSHHHQHHGHHVVSSSTSGGGGDPNASKALASNVLAHSVPSPAESVNSPASAASSSLSSGCGGSGSGDAGGRSPASSCGPQSPLGSTGEESGGAATMPSSPPVAHQQQTHLLPPSSQHHKPNASKSQHASSHPDTLSRPPIDHSIANLTMKKGPQSATPSPSGPPHFHRHHAAHGPHPALLSATAY